MLISCALTFLLGEIEKMTTGLSKVAIKLTISKYTLVCLSTDS